MADRFEKILADVSCNFEYRGNDVRTGRLGWEWMSRTDGERTLLVALGVDYEELVVRLFL
jgi:hypothetical protein